MPGLTETEKNKISDAFERAAVNAGFKLQVRASLGDELQFSDVAKDMGTGLAIGYVVDRATDELRRRGINLSLGSGGGWWNDVKPDRYTLIVDGKRVYGAVSWDF